MEKREKREKKESGRGWKEEEAKKRGDSEDVVASCCRVHRFLRAVPLLSSSPSSGSLAPIHTLAKPSRTTSYSQYYYYHYSLLFLIIIQSCCYYCYHCYYYTGQVSGARVHLRKNTIRALVVLREPPPEATSEKQNEKERKTRLAGAHLTTVKLRLLPSIDFYSISFLIFPFAQLIF